MTADAVKAYYGRTLQSSADLITDACCDASDVPPRIRAAIAETHEEVRRRYYGCGLAVPLKLDGARVLDLGCGAGRDVYALSRLVGPDGAVVGVDMTPEQLDVARAHQGWHAERFGYDNVAFVEGELEDLDRLGLAPASFDVIVSNCVINLCRDKAGVIAAARRLLKPGGEFYFADVYADRRQDPALADDPVLYGECLAGALYWNDFLAMAKAAGFADPRLVEDRPITVSDPAAREKLGETAFFSATYRLFNIDDLEPACEDYGQAVVYRGGIEDAEDRFVLDKHHDIEVGRVFPVCGNTWRMLAESRFSPHFDFIGTFDRHYGIFEGCGTPVPFDTQTGRAGAGTGCC
ncbi:methyltransferase type 11 [Marinicauda salina]|uniref:Arsenite methyltransferase n=1 Tax=Marinicauda salina TaxID=2135793 RepID=A0A2U2BSG2_9PROT|nr:methyltransferase domain-containing protein [Marinicauda salina]PWE16930.1 methyltransferase type 11 [Marinicauda salina]